MIISPFYFSPNASASFIMPQIVAPEIFNGYNFLFQITHFWPDI